MARLNKKLSIVIPTINEASRLPLLLADLNKWSDQLEICICDARSSDLTTLVAELAGALVIQVIEANRGFQLHTGALNTNGNWLLFLHADCRMPKNWVEVVRRKIDDSSSKDDAWFFEFKIKSLHIPLYINDRRWSNVGIIVQALKNAHLRKRWRSGERPKDLAMEYYKK